MPESLHFGYPDTCELPERVPNCLELPTNWQPNCHDKVSNCCELATSCRPNLTSSASSAATLSTILTLNMMMIITIILIIICSVAMTVQHTCGPLCLWCRTMPPKAKARTKAKAKAVARHLRRQQLALANERQRLRRQALAALNSLTGTPVGGSPIGVGPG